MGPLAGPIFDCIVRLIWAYEKVGSLAAAAMREHRDRLQEQLWPVAPKAHPDPIYQAILPSDSYRLGADAQVL